MASNTVPELNERDLIAIEAAGEIEVIADTMVKLSQDVDSEVLIFRSLSLRARELAGLVCIALTDHLEKVEKMRSRVTGLRAPASDLTSIHLVASRDSLDERYDDRLRARAGPAAS